MVPEKAGPVFLKLNILMTHFEKPQMRNRPSFSPWFHVSDRLIAFFAGLHLGHWQQGPVGHRQDGYRLRARQGEPVAPHQLGAVIYKYIYTYIYIYIYIYRYLYVEDILTGTCMYVYNIYI